MKDSRTHPGQVEKTTWRRFEVHAHSSYGCGYCGLRFESPCSFYTHRDKVHERGRTSQGERRSRPATAHPDREAA